MSLHYIIDTHIVNHYENVIPNMFLFFIVGLYIGRAENGYLPFRCVETAMAASVASILFGQPMFIILCLFISRRLASFMFSY